jgi:hypothetical protein
VEFRQPGATTARGPTVRIGRYDLTSELFRSEVDALWSGRATGGDEDTPVLVRRIMKKPPVSEEAFQAITEAAFSLVDVRHSRFAAITDVVVTANEIAVVSEHTPGRLLLRVQQAAKLKQAPLPIAAALRLTVDLLDGLAACGPLFMEADVAENRLYGGFTPDFAWVTAEGEALLLDLSVGLAIAADKKLARIPHFLAYRSPEQLTASADARSDVFAVGVTLWELLANRSHIPSSSRPDPRKPPRPIARLDSLTRPDSVAVSRPLADLVAKAVDFDPAARFATAQEMADAIHGLGADRIGAMADVRTAVDRLSQPAATLKAQTAPSAAKPPEKPAAVSAPAAPLPRAPAAPLPRMPAAPLPPPKVPAKSPAPAAAAPPAPEPAVPELRADEPPAEKPEPVTPPTASITALFDDLVLPSEPVATEAATIAEVPRFDSGPVAELLSSPSMKAINVSARPVENAPRKRWHVVVAIAVSAVLVAAIAVAAAMVLLPETPGENAERSARRNPFARFQIFRGARADAGTADAASDAGDSDSGDRPHTTVPAPRTAPTQPDAQGDPSHDKPPPKKKPFMPTAI